MHRLQSGAIPTRGGAALPAIATASSEAECQRSRRAGCADRSGAAPVLSRRQCRQRQLRLCVDLVNARVTSRIPEAARPIEE